MLRKNFREKQPNLRHSRRSFSTSNMRKTRMMITIVPYSKISREILKNFIALEWPRWTKNWLKKILSLKSENNLSSDWTIKLTRWIRVVKKSRLNWNHVKSKRLDLRSRWITLRPNIFSCRKNWMKSKRSLMKKLKPNRWSFGSRKWPRSN